jgi:hypothetical protein
MRWSKKIGNAIFLGFVLCLVLCASAQALVHEFSEDFYTLVYRDSIETNANWDSTAGLTTMWPFETSLAGSVYTPYEAHGVAISGDYAYVGDFQSGLQVIDISDPANPTIVGSYNTPGDAWGVAIAGDYAYVADDGGLQVIDISDPTSPTFAGSYTTPGSAIDVAISGDYAFVTDYYQGVQVIDIADPSSPSLAGTYNTPDRAYGIDIAGDLAFVADSFTGLVILDISDPTNPDTVRICDTPSDANGVDVAGDYAYVADGTSGIQVIDISDPTSPFIAGSYVPLPNNNAWDVVVSGDYAYMAQGFSGLQVIDISDPTSPGPSENFNTPGNSFSVVVSGEFAYVADYTFGLQVIEVADAVLPPLPVGSYDTPGDANRVAVSGDYAYVADWTSGLQVVDVADPTTPVWAGSLGTPGGARDVAVAGDYAYVADASSGLQVVDITDPTNPTPAGSYNTTHKARAVVVSGDYAYVADYYSGLQVIDIADPTTPTLAGSYDTPGWAWGVAVSGDYAYVADLFGGLQVIDISDPTNPGLAAEYMTPGTPFGVAISGDYAYVADGDSGLVVLDITDPATPTLAGDLRAPYAAFGVAVSGDYAYLGGWGAGLVVVDISDPTDPVWTESREGGDAWGVTISGDHAYIGNRSFGLLVMEVFERGWDLDSNTVQSLVVFQTDDEISGVKLTPSHPDSIWWYVSADSGASWDSVGSDSDWYQLTSLGGDLLWRARLLTRTDGLSSSCNSLDLEWRYSFAEVDSVIDVPEDEGGWARVRFDPSGLDIGGLGILSSPVSPDGRGSGSERPVTGGGSGSAYVNNYGVHRRIDDVGFTERILEEGERLNDETSFSVDSDHVLTFPSSLGGWRAYAMDGRHFYVQELPLSGAFPPGIWETVGNVPATHENIYYGLVPTVVDSMGVGDYTVYCVSAHTPDPEVYHFSPPDSGYSVDNLAPEAPVELTAEHSGAPTDLLIKWNRSTKRDFSHFSVYKGASEGFLPGEANRIGVPWDTVFVDRSFDARASNYYKVSAWDIHGNESEFSLLSDEDIDEAMEAPAPPTVTALEQNVPNPFNPVTTIRFSVAEPGWVTLVIFDVAGRPVCSLVQGRKEIDRYEAVWDGRDERGRTVASGVYLYQLMAPGYVESKKMILLR